MFSGSIERILKSCGSGCQNLWSDPNKQAGAYGVVNKEEIELGEHSQEEEPLAEGGVDIVTSQPIWTESPIVKNPSIVRNIPPFPAMSEPIVKNKRPSQTDVRRSNRDKTAVSTAKSSEQLSELRRGSLGSNQKPNIFSSPIVKSPSSQVLSSKGSANTYKSTRKQKSEEVKLQIVSVV